MGAYAIVESGSKQYRVEPKSVIEVEKVTLPDEKKEILLEKVLLVGDGEKVWVGQPLLKGAKVVCDYLGDIRARKVMVLKFRRRKASRRKRGHRQTLSRLLVKEIAISS